MFRGSSSINDMFRKGLNTARDIASNVSSYSKTGGNILKTIGDIGGRIMNIDEIKRLGDGNPNVQRAINITNKGLGYIDKGANLANQLSNFTNENTYTGTNEENIGNALQRAKNIKRTADTIRFV